MSRIDRYGKLEKALRRRRDQLRAVLRGDLETLTKLSPVRGEIADVAVETAHEDLISQLADSENRELRNVEEALSRMQAGTYGNCEGCDKPIPLARLEVLPYAKLCIKCQTMVERAGCVDWSEYAERGYDSLAGTES
ncbi:MAG: hypothetical protein KatS3mg111_0342 [Pirellulaceae bacterium]|nr:MAG: hypothetical protein KatS3mg111_0342 [Pirellulaceae bacterium]